MTQDACIFVPKEDVHFFSDCGSARGEYPIGVSFNSLDELMKAF